MEIKAHYEIRDAIFETLIDPEAPLECLHTGTGYSEGPAYFGGGRYLVWSDIPRSRMLRYDETDGSVSVFREPTKHSNGNTVDRQGRLVTCEHDSRRVTRTEHDGSITTLAERWEGKRLNSPNDAVVRSDGSIWFTDPPYGIDNNYGRPKFESEIGGNYVFRLDPETGDLTPVVTDMDKPNGLAFSPDESVLYVVDSGLTHDPEGPAHIRQYRVETDGSLSGGEVVIGPCDSFIYDGLRIDTEGRIWTSAGDGVQCFTPDGRMLGKILTGEVCGNVEFGGGPSRSRLYICCASSLYAVNLRVSGMKTR